MDCKRGEIHTGTVEQIKAIEGLTGRKLAPLKSSEARTLSTMDRPRRKGWMRNQPCPCGAKMKFKRCCWSLYA